MSLVALRYENYRTKTKIMMKLAQTISITASISIACIITGTLSNQRVLQEMGKVAGLGAISTGVLLKIQSLDAEKQKQLSKFQQENISLQAKLAETQTELTKLEKKVQIHNTRQRLSLSSIQKLQHQQQVISKTVANFEQKLADSEKYAASKTNNVTPKPNGSSVKTIAPSPEPVTRVYIDGNNLSFAIDSLQIELDYDALRIELSQNAIRTNFKFYTGVHSPMNEGQKRFLAYLMQLRYEVIGLPILARSDSQTLKTVGDDVKIAVDMISEVKNGDRVILVSGDGDFIPAVAEVQRRGAKVTVVAKKKMLSEQLAQIANEVIYLDDIQYDIAKYRKLDVA
ncbi:MAG: NYN domain-containing protein [Nostoc sp. CmiSLP01]|nr:NYN domain-containing protein [Nostoc sp. CmiSLP01]MDZ8289055.1 NYN domain-containing protein [Nostoc sp. ChiSLP01]